jgi:hypothetical protein
LFGNKQWTINHAVIVHRELRIRRETPMSPFDREEQLRSHTFVLTLWRERDGGPWRAALRPADGGARLGFADLEQLVAFLLGLADQRVPPDRMGADGPNANGR